MSRTLVCDEDPQHQVGKRASYRLFPVVTSTPPASPVSARLSQNAHSLQCRSSSMPYGVNCPTLPQPLTATSLSILNPRPDSDEVDTPKLRPKSALEEEVKVDCNHRQASYQTSTSVSQPSTEVRDSDAIPDDRLSRSNSAPKEESRNSRNAVSTMATPASSTTIQSDDIDLTSFFPLAPTFASHQDRKRVRSKPKPNLRINVGDHAMEDRPPPPPPKSPRRLPTVASGCSKVDSRSPPSAGVARPGPDSWAAVAPSIAVQVSCVPLSADIKTRELSGQSNATRERPARRLLPQFLSAGSTSATERPSLVRKPVTRLNTGPTESSPDSATDGTLQIPPVRSPSPIDVVKTESPVDDAQKKRYVAYRPPTSSGIESSSEKPVPLLWTSRSHSPQTMATANAAVDHASLVSRLDGARSVSPVDSIADSSSHATVRQVTSAGPLNSNPYIPSPMFPPASNPTILEPRTFSPSKAPSPIRIVSDGATPATYGNVVPSGSPKRSDASHVSPPDPSTGAFSRALTPEPSSTMSRASSIAFMDPVERLKELTEKCEVLHAKYASLRAERQKISGGIIASLKTAKSNAETMSALLNEQLSLAATSSAMDICFAKLQALECQKEDAVTTLVAQAGSLRRTMVDSIAGSPARNTTHPLNQLSPALDPLSCVGQLTPGFAESERFLQPNRPVVETGNMTEMHGIGNHMQEMTPRANGQQSPPGFSPSLHLPPRNDSVVSGDPLRKPALEHEFSHSDEDIEKVPMSALEGILSSETLDEGTRKVHVDGPKAAKILGLLARSDSRKASSSIRVPDGFEDMLLKKQPKLELEICSVMRSEDLHDSKPDQQQGASQSLLTPDEEIDPIDLYTEPRASALPLRPTTPPAETTLPVLPSARYGSPVKVPPQQTPPDEPEAPSSPKSLKSVKSFKSIKSYKSTKKGNLHQTIKVFMDDDILQYYRALQEWGQTP